MSFKKKLSDIFNKNRNGIGTVSSGTLAVLCGVVAVGTPVTVPLGIAGSILFGAIAVGNGIDAARYGRKTKAGKAAIAFTKAATQNAAARVKKIFHKKPGL